MKSMISETMHPEEAKESRLEPREKTTTLAMRLSDLFL